MSQNWYVSEDKSIEVLESARNGHKYNALRGSFQGPLKLRAFVRTLGIFLELRKLWMKAFTWHVIISYKMKLAQGYYV